MRRGGGNDFTSLTDGKGCQGLILRVEEAHGVVDADQAGDGERQHREDTSQLVEAALGLQDQLMILIRPPVSANPMPASNPASLTSPVYPLHP